MGVPDSGLDAALGFSMESGIPYGIGLIKNKYIGRTFDFPRNQCPYHNNRDAKRVEMKFAYGFLWLLLPVTTLRYGRWWFPSQWNHQSVPQQV